VLKILMQNIFFYGEKSIRIFRSAWCLIVVEQGEKNHVARQMELRSNLAEIAALCAGKKLDPHCPFL
jgi:hypothetical protein